MPTSPDNSSSAVDGSGTAAIASGVSTPNKPCDSSSGPAVK